MSDSLFVCSFESCSKQFKKKSRLEAHIRSHTGEKPYVCVYDDCDKKYARAAHLKRHEESVHLDSTTGEDGSDLASGVGGEVGSPPKQYKCQYAGCGKVFKKHKLLKSHICCVHAEVKQYKCPHDGCGKSFWCSSKLKCHSKVHEGYKCDVEGCDAVLPKWTLLRKHKMLEHKSAESRCSVCGKTFRQRSWLKQHQAVHEEGRSVFECPRDNCGRTYLDLRNLTAHIRSYHDGKRFPCPHPGCDRTFTTKQKQLQHQGLHDPNRPPPKKRVNKGGRKRNVAATLSGYNPRTMAAEAKLPPHDPEDMISMEELEEGVAEPMDQDGASSMSGGSVGTRGMEMQAGSVTHTMAADSGVFLSQQEDSLATDSSQFALPAVATPSADWLGSREVSSAGCRPCGLDECAVAASSSSTGVQPASEAVRDANFPSQPLNTMEAESAVEDVERDVFQAERGRHVAICGLCGAPAGECSMGCSNSTASVPHFPGADVGQTEPGDMQEMSVVSTVNGGGDSHAQEALTWRRDSGQGSGKDQPLISKQLLLSTDLITDAIMHLADRL